MRVAIVGGGLTGLTAGFRLSQAGHRVTIFEKEKQLGGLAAGFQIKNWQWSLEHFFHHFFTSDQEAVGLIRELGLLKKLSFFCPCTSIFKNGRIFPFDSPQSVLQFPFLSPTARLRFGLVTFYLKMANNWQSWEKITAFNWLKKNYGQKSFRVLWKPLLEKKFASYAGRIAMAWFWARIKKRSRRLGYLKGGFQVLIDKLAREIKNKNGEIITQRAVDKIGFHYSKFIIHHSEFDKVIVTVPTPEFLKMKFLPRAYRRSLNRLSFVGALNLVFVLKKKFLVDGTYWLNINEKKFPFVAVVEHTNFVDRQYYAGQNILYVGGYYPQDHRYFQMSKEAIFQEFLPYLQKVNPSFDFSLFTIHYSLFTDLSAQPVIPLNYSKIMPAMKTPIKNIYLANQSLIYPWDRGVNYAIKLGKEVARLIGGEGTK